MNDTDHNIWPSLVYTDAAAGRAWLERLGFRPGIVVPGDAPDVIHHSEMDWQIGRAHV